MPTKPKTSLLTRTSRLKGYDPRYSFNRGMIAQTGCLPEGTQLLEDVYPLKVLDTKSVIAEGTKGGVPITRVTGIFQEAEKQNANGRVYPHTVLREAVDAIQEDLNRRAVWAEFDHPADAKIHMDRISHLVTRLWMEGNKVVGEAEILEELPFGHQLKVLLKHGSVGISSRGIGDLEMREHNGEETYIVSPGFRLVTFDAVAEPSVSGARLQLVEGKLRPLTRVGAPQITNNLVDSKHYEKMLTEEFDRHFGLL